MYPHHALGLDACLYRGKLKWNDPYPRKLVEGKDTSDSSH
jgi:hypothetical protein